MDWKTILLAFVLLAMPYAMADEGYGAGSDPFLSASLQDVNCKTTFMVSYISELSTMFNSSGLLNYSSKLTADTAQLQTLASSGDMAGYSAFLSSTYDVDIAQANTAIAAAQPWANATDEQKAAIAASYASLKADYNTCTASAVSSFANARIKSYVTKINKYRAERDRLAAMGLNTTGLDQILNDAQTEVMIPLQAALINASNHGGTPTSPPGNQTNVTTPGNDTNNTNNQTNTTLPGNDTNNTNNQTNTTLDNQTNTTTPEPISVISVTCALSNSSINSTLNISGMTLNIPYTIGNESNSISAVCNATGTSISCEVPNPPVGLNQNLSGLSATVGGVDFTCDVFANMVIPPTNTTNQTNTTTGNQTNTTNQTNSSNSTQTRSLVAQAIHQYCLFGGCKDGINFHLDAKFETEKLAETIAFMRQQNLSNSSLDLLDQAQGYVDDAKAVIAQVGTSDYARGQKQQITKDLNQASKLIKQALSNHRKEKKDKEDEQGQKDKEDGQGQKNKSNGANQGKKNDDNEDEHAPVLNFTQNQSTNSSLSQNSTAPTTNVTGNQTGTNVTGNQTWQGGHDDNEEESDNESGRSNNSGRNHDGGKDRGDD